MAGTPEEDLLAWLEREEEAVGFAAFEEAMTDFQKARVMYFEQVGLDMSEDQFAALTAVGYTRYVELPAAGVTFTLRETKAGWYAQYKYEPTGQFISSEAAFGLLAMER